MAAPAPDEAGAPKEQEMVFLVEVLEVTGLLKPETTSVQLTGFGLDTVFSSLPLTEESTDPSGWMFLANGSTSEQAVGDEPAAKAKGKAAPAKEKGKTPPGTGVEGEETPQSPRPTPHARLAKPCSMPEQRQRLLDVCAGSALNIDLVRQPEPTKQLGRASILLKDLVHITSSIEEELTLEWSEEFLAEWRQEQEEAAAKAAEEAAAKAAEAAAEAEAAGQPPPEPPAEGAAEEATEIPTHPSAGPPKMRVRISTASPIGRVLCPEDLDDWTVLTVQVEGCFGLPETLLLPSPLPEGREGVLEEHPLNYSIRILGCEFDGGQLVLPPLPPEPDPAADPPADATAPPDDGDAAATAEDAAGAGGLSPMAAPAFVASIGKEEFVEGLVRTGFGLAHEVGPALFDFLDIDGAGVIGPDEFSRIDHLGKSAQSAKLVALCDWFIEKNQSLDEAFTALDSSTRGCVSLEDWLAGLESFEGESEEKEALFSMLADGNQPDLTPDSPMMINAVSRQAFLILGLYRKIADLQKIEKTATWLSQSVDSSDALWQQVDTMKAGSANAITWQAAMTSLGYPSQEDADAAFKLMDATGEGVISKADLEVLNKLGAPLDGGSQPALLKFHALLVEIAEGDNLFDTFSNAIGVENDALSGQEIGATFSAPDFVAACKHFGYDGLSAHPLVIFTLLDVCQSGTVGAPEFQMLAAYADMCKRNRLAACKSFIYDSFGSAELGFRSLFEDRSEACKVAEEKAPILKFPEPVVTCYRGRSWLQQLFNTTNDDRGRKLAAQKDVASGGTWLHFFPTPKGRAEPVDYKEITDPAQTGPARTARWHHAQAFVDLRRLVADAENGDAMPFQAYLCQVSSQPSELLQDAELPKAPFGSSRMYVKGTVKFDRPPRLLCPRPGEIGAGSLPEKWIPSPPEKKPPPTSSEELETESHRVVAKLASEFARMCREQGLEQPHLAANGKDVIRLLGSSAKYREFLGWLSQQDNGAVMRDLTTDLTRAIVRLIRSDHPESPSCGLTGNEKDAQYTGLHTHILKHFIRALNGDVNEQRFGRDARLWKNAGLTGAVPGETAATDEEDVDAPPGPADEVTLQRLVFEYELCGSWGRATELFQERLKLTQNAERSEAWYDYARFLMRTGQRQVEAEDALRFAICLQPSDVGPSLKQATFLACIMENKQLPTSFDVSQDFMRFDVACQLLSQYVDKQPTKRTPLFFLFMVYAFEAQGCKDAFSAGPQMPNDREYEAAMKRYDQLSAMASKYLELARAPDSTFAGTLAPRRLDGQPLLPDLEDLVRRERLERKELEAATMDAPPEQPESWRPPPYPAMATFESVHALEDRGDEAALGCIDLMLHFGLAGLVPFAIVKASESYGFLSPKTVASERCQLQVVKAYMLQGRWLEAAELLQQLFARCDRLRDAHLLLGECRFRLAKERAQEGGNAAVEAPALYAEARQSFETALAFLSKPGPDMNAPGDSVVHFRLASTHFADAEAADFTEEKAMSKAMQHYKRSLTISPTAEVWLRAGVCAYRQACLGRQRSLFRCKEPAPEYQSADPEQVQKRQSGFKEASKYLTEANLLDVTRPEINAWLVICAVEMGHVQIAKQALRQVLSYDSRLDAATCLELAVVLLRASDESRAAPGERKWIVQDGRYAKEVILVGNVLTSMKDCGEVRYILGLAHIIQNNDAAALPELEAAVPWFNHDTPCQDEINNVLRLCALRLNGGASGTVGPITVASAPPRTAAQEKEFAERLEETRQGVNPEGRDENPGLADFYRWETGFEVYDYDLPEIWEAVAEGQKTILKLRGARLGAWGVREISTRIRESPGLLREVDVTGCAAVGELGKQLVNSYPYKRGVSMEAAQCGLPDEDVVRLRNRSEDSDKTLRRAVAEQRRSEDMCAAYMARQDALEQLGLEEGDQAPPLKFAYCPSRWREGLEWRAEQAFSEFVAANPWWGPAYSENDFIEHPDCKSYVITKSGATVNLDDSDIQHQDFMMVMKQKRIQMLVDDGAIKREEEKREEEAAGELDDEKRDGVSDVSNDYLPAAAPLPFAVTMLEQPTARYLQLFGENLELNAKWEEEEGEFDDGETPGYDRPRGATEYQGYSFERDSFCGGQRLIAFMAFLGVPALPEEVAFVKAEREAEEAEREAEEAERREQLRRINEARRAEEERIRKAWEEQHKELIAARNDITDRANAEHNGSRQLPKGMSSGQIIAHFTYLCLNRDLMLGDPLQPLSKFALQKLSAAPRPKPRRGHDFHEALFTGKIAIEEATGMSFGTNALCLKLQSLASEPIEIAVRRGTIFQHTNWVHKQNLLVAIDYLVKIPAGGCVEKQMMAHCMNLSCSCSAGETMELTEFYFDSSHVLDSQGNVWDHFETCFGHR